MTLKPLLLLLNWQWLLYQMNLVQQGVTGKSSRNKFGCG